MSRRENQDSNLTKQDLQDFKTWVERRFEDLRKQQPVNSSSQTTRNGAVGSTVDVGWTLMEENPSSDYYDSHLKQEHLGKDRSKSQKSSHQAGRSHEQTLQKILDGQRQLEALISVVTGKLEQEKQFMRDELKNAQDEIMKRLQNIEFQMTHLENRFHESATRLEDKIQEAKTNVQSQTTGCTELMFQTVKEFTSKVKEEMKTFIDVVQQCHQSPNTPGLITMKDESLNEFLDKVQKAVEYSVQGKLEGHLVRGSNNGLSDELKGINVRLDGLTSTLAGQEAAYSQMTENCTAHMMEEIQKSEKNIETKLIQNLGNVEEKITGNTETAIGNLGKNLAYKNQEAEEQLKTHVVQQIQMADKSLKGEMRQTKAEMIQQIKQSCDESCQNTTVEIETNLKTNTEIMKDFITDIKREIFKVTEKECFITRQMLADPSTHVRSSIFDFYVENFADLAKSGKDMYSVPWHIDEFQLYVEGRAWFSPNGEIKVYLNYGRHHLEMGLQPRRGKLRVKVVLTDVTGALPDLLIGEGTNDWNEEEVKNNGNWGCHFGTLKCDEVISCGYDKRTGYENGAVLLRFHIDVL